MDIKPGKDSSEFALAEQAQRASTAIEILSAIAIIAGIVLEAFSLEGRWAAIIGGIGIVATQLSKTMINRSYIEGRSNVKLQANNLEAWKRADGAKDTKDANE